VGKWKEDGFNGVVGSAVKWKMVIEAPTQ